MVEAQHKIACAISHDSEGVSVRRLFSYLSPDALQTLLDLVERVKRDVTDVDKGTAPPDEESMMLVAATSLRLAKTQILSYVLHSRPFFRLVSSTMILVLLLAAVLPHPCTARSSRYFRKDVYGLYTSYCHTLPADVADVVLGFRDLLLRMLEHPVMMRNTALHNEALLCFTECWEIFYPTRELQLRLLYTVLFATTAAGTTSESVREPLLWATLNRLASRAGGFLRLFPEKRPELATESSMPQQSMPVSGDEAYEAITVSTNPHEVTKLADPTGES
jgi:hypothetical protein